MFNILIMNILMVCLGNICRSPIAEGVLRRHCQERGLNWRVDSAGTAGYHVGEAPDRRAIACLRSKGIDISGLRARQLTRVDLDEFDLVLVMDQSNLRDVLRLCGTPAQRDKVRLLMDYTDSPGSPVPDPYYGSERDFELVYALCDQACRALAEAYL